jgi:hypothetical protein
MSAVKIKRRRASIDMDLKEELERYIKKQEMLAWLKEYDENYSTNSYDISLDYIINATGSVIIKARGLKSIPYQFGKVSDGFDCSANELTNLKVCPKYVGRNFDCSHNNLTNLRYVPELIVADFYFRNNSLGSLSSFIEFPRRIGRQICDNYPGRYVYDGIKSHYGNFFDNIDSIYIFTQIDTNISSLAFTVSLYAIPDIKFRVMIYNGSDGFYKISYYLDDIIICCCESAYLSTNSVLKPIFSVEEIRQAKLNLLVS